MTTNNRKRRRTPPKTTPPQNGTPNRPRKKRRKRKGKRVLHYMLISIILLITGFVLSFTVFFKIEYVTAFGVEHYTPEKVAEASGILPGSNLFLANTKVAEQKLLEAFPYIEDVSVRRVFPPGIEIQVTPSVAVAALEQANKDYILITYQGKVLEKGLGLVPNDALLVKGVSLSKVEPGFILGTWLPTKVPTTETDSEETERLKKDAALEEEANEQKEVLRMLHFLFDAMEQSKFSDITNIDFTDRYNMQINYENRLILKLGSEADLTDKLVYARELITNEMHSKADGIINFAEIRRNRVYYKPNTIDWNGKPFDSNDKEYSENIIEVSEKDEESD